MVIRFNSSEGIVAGTKLNSYSFRNRCDIRLSTAYEERYRAMLMQRCGEACLIMGCAMRDTARAFVEASLREQRPQAREMTIRKGRFLRFYGHEFDAQTCDKILAAIERAAQPDLVMISRLLQHLLHLDPAVSMVLSQSLQRHFVGIDFDQSQSPIGDMFSFIESIPYLDGSYQEIADDHKSEVACRRGLEGAADHGSVVDTRYCGRDIQFGVEFIEKLYSDAGKGSGSCVLQHVKEWEIEQDLSLAENPRLSWHCGLTCGRKSRDGLPQTLWGQAFVSPSNLDEEDIQHRSE